MVPSDKECHEPPTGSPHGQALQAADCDGGDPPRTPGRRVAPDPLVWLAAVETALQLSCARRTQGKRNRTSLSGRPRAVRDDLALAAIRLIRADDGERASATSIARHLGVTLRALEYAFSMSLGASPSQVILAVRLGRARADLLKPSSPSTTVTRVAFAHNFANLSRFAQQYMRLFGERPSQTIRRARNRAAPSLEARSSLRAPPGLGSSTGASAH